MRIGIDMLGLQSATSRFRGIGRYSRGLVSALVDLAPRDEFVLYGYDGLPTDDFPSAPNAAVRPLPPQPARADAIESVTRGNPDRLDLLLLTSPLEFQEGYAPPARPIDGPATAAVVYDLVPFLFQERYLTWPPMAERFYRNLERLRRYDALLAISEATRRDTLRLLGLPGDRVANVSGATEPGIFSPDPAEAASPAGIAELRRLGIDRPFVFCQASMDWRKNLFGLLDAYRLLPESVRDAHQLVLAFALSEDDAATLRREAERRGLLDRLVLTGEISDPTLRLLYRGCAAFAMPSLYEGLGLPLLEAMHCGAAVVGGNNSSQVEIVGDAGLLANAQDAADIANSLGRLLSEPGLADRLRAAAPVQAARFTWAESARRALAALTAAVERQPRKRRRVDRPRVALVSPFPPKASGIADYAARLARELRPYYRVDLYHDDGYEPDLGRDEHDFGLYDYRLFARNARVLGYRGVVYQMGNSHYHRFLYEMMEAHPGIVTLHDFGLGGFHWWYNKHGGAPAGHFDREVRRSHPDQADAILAQRTALDAEEGGMADALARRSLYMNRGLFDRADRVIVHAPWCIEQARRLCPEHLDRTVVIPFGVTPRPATVEARQATRDRFSLPREALVFGSFGYLHDFKMNAETIEAFAALAGERPEALLIFVGQDLGRGEAARQVEHHGLAHRVRFLGRQPEAEYNNLISAIDIGICLRRPPTVGETSAALLDLLCAGIPTVVTEVGTFADNPDDVVRKVRWGPDGPAELARAFRDLAADRSALGAAALRHVERHHAWPIAARRYVDVIEATAGARDRPSASFSLRRGNGALSVAAGSA